MTEKEEIEGRLSCCKICPRSCGANRLAGERGLCGEGAEIRLASASIHMGEEPPVTGKGGSGTVFISGCALRCVFCQNYQISQGAGDGTPPLGRAVDSEEFTAITLALQERGAENINLVTGSHFTPVLVSRIRAAKKAGLRLPVLWNSSAYETEESIASLDGVVDMFLPDLKTLDPGVAQKFFNCGDYPGYAVRAIKKMLELKPGNVIIRHLVLPGCPASTYAVLKWFRENAAGRAQLSLMTQFTPVRMPRGLAAPDRFLNREEYEAALSALSGLGIEDGWYQEPGNSDDWLPDFNRPNPFPSALSAPVWHWQDLPRTR